MSVPMYSQIDTEALIEMVSGDGGTLLDLNIHDLQGNAVDLSTAASAWLRFKIASAAVQVRQMTITLPKSEGRVVYQFVPTDTADQSGFMQYEVFTKDSGGNVLNTQLNPGLLRVRAPLS